MRKMPWNAQVAFGESLRDSNGSERYLTFEEAKNACLDLNPKDQRETVEKAIGAREQALDALRKKYSSQLEYNKQDSLSDKAKGEFDKILATPIGGCYLPNREEYKVLESDFGGQENKYIPQILPQSGLMRLWSSSGDPINSNLAFLWNGDNGVVDKDYLPNYSRPLRCCCQVEPSR